MDTEKIRSLALSAQAQLQQILDNIGPPPVTAITTPDEFERAVSAAVTGDRLILDPAFVYAKPFTLTKAIALESATYTSRVATRMTLDEPAPKFLNGLTTVSGMHGLRGLELTMTDPVQLKDGSIISTMGGDRGTWERMRILGDPTLGSRRGINFIGGRGAVIDSYIGGIFRADRDAQAIYSQQMLVGGGLVLSNDYFEASGECVLFGGGDSISDVTMPSNATMIVGPGKHKMFVKNGLEGKAIDGLICQRCMFTNCGGISDGQQGDPLVFTPRNQGKTAPWTNVTNVLVEDFKIAGIGNGIINILGHDDKGNMSGTLTNLILRRGNVTGLDRAFYGKDASGNWSATGRLFQFERAPDRVTFDTIHAEAVHATALGYFIGTGKPAPTNLVMVNLDLPTSTYGHKIDGGASGRKALLAYMPDAQLDATVV